ncbi:MAG: glycosyltransferase family 4 protein [bacterium]
MRGSKAIVILDPLAWTAPGDAAAVGMEEFKRWIRSGAILRRLFRYSEARLLTPRIEYITKPLMKAFFLRLLSFGTCCFEDETGRRERITIFVLAGLLWRFVRDSTRKPAFTGRIIREVERLMRDCESGRPRKTGGNLSARPVYLRTEPHIGIRSGGSVGHIAGVLNNLDKFTGKPVFLTNCLIPTVRSDVETRVIPPGTEFWEFAELPYLLYNDAFEESAHRILNREEISFVYQRYSYNSYSGVRLAGSYGVPFVLEYNGSELWINRHWGNEPLKYLPVYERIELLNLRAADVVVVVSRPSKDELVARGIEPGKILVNPNGVDPDRYSPGVDGSAVRDKYGFGGRTVIGFIGTFGLWHGAEVLAEAFGRLLKENPGHGERVRLLMIGDGARMSQVRKILSDFNVNDVCALTGFIPQEEGPSHLAACDVLASPHVPNPDGTPFFGSPTKLFEYMAMGRGIVASDLDQIGEVLEHDRTAWMVEPGNVDSLLSGLKTLIDDRQLRERLGSAARAEAVEKYTWEQHTRRIVDRIKALFD